jgi:hypothetical protein
MRTLLDSETWGEITVVMAPRERRWAKTSHERRSIVRAVIRGFATFSRWRAHPFVGSAAVFGRG